jgi:hypothetical protein
MLTGLITFDEVCGRRVAKRAIFIMDGWNENLRERKKREKKKKVTGLMLSPQM